MSTIYLVPEDLRSRYHVKEWRNATGILATAHPGPWQDIIEVLRGFTLLRSEIEVSGGNRSLISRRIDGAFYGKGWVEKDFKTAFVIDDREIQSPTHAVDCFRDGVALEVEWNNKDPFFDRDLNNFRLLFELRAIDVGIIITRAAELQNIFKEPLINCASILVFHGHGDPDLILANVDGFTPYFRGRNPRPGRLQTQITCQA